MGQTLHYLDYTCPTPEENLALDDALLEICETNPLALLRTWEPRSPFVVLGRSRRYQVEVDTKKCQTDNIPILRRQSGGGTVLQLPGCLNFSLILPITYHKQCLDISATTQFILKKNLTALSPTLSKLSIKGTSDFAINEFKIAGHAQRRLKKSLLFHGCFLLNANLDLISNYLMHPVDEPLYRKKRPHSDFLMNIQIPASTIKTNLSKEWHATNTLIEPPTDCLEQMHKIIHEKYQSLTWNKKY